jgi:hypothetical protein
LHPKYEYPSLEYSLIRAHTRAKIGAWTGLPSRGGAQMELNPVG